MALSDQQLQALNTELTTDPQGRGYAGMTDRQARDDLNLARIGDNVPFMETHELYNLLHSPELAAIGNNESAKFGRLQLIFTRVGGSKVLPTDTAYLELASIFGGASQTKANMDAALGTTISRAEDLFGVGTVLTTGDVMKARAL